MAMLTLLQCVGVGIAALIAHGITLAIYRLYFHPLSKFPGPRLAAATFWFEFYYDAVRSGTYIWEIEKMHKLYGPIVRINPTQLHINDPDFYEEIYSGSHRKRDKPANWSPGTAESSAFATADHDLHRSRRAALNPFFSKRSIVRFESRISEMATELCDRLADEMKRERVVPLLSAFTALTIDIITDYCYAKSWNFLEDDDYHGEWREMMTKIIDTQHLRAHFPWMGRGILHLPESWLVKLMPGMEQLVSRDKEIVQHITTVLNATDAEKRNERDNIFVALRDNPDLSTEERSLRRLADEGAVMIVAGSETTARALAHTTYYVLNTPGVLPKLRAELKTVMPKSTSKPTLSELERLPYLTAVIQEGLRFAFGVATRLPRLPHEPLRYGDWVIPPKTPVSQSTYLVHFNSEIFPDPFQFKPERWLQNDGERRLDRYLVSFIKGTRQCMGINLAWAELYIGLAAVFRRFDLELFEMTLDDVKFARDMFVPMEKVGSNGVRVIVKGEME